NRWSFQNVRSMVPTVDVPRGSGPVAPFAYDLQDFSNLAFTSVTGEQRTVSAMLAETYTDGFLVMSRGKVVCEHYFNDMTPMSLHLSQSVAKSVTSALAGVLHGEGLLDLDAPLADLVPELGQCGFADATLSHVLDMQSGVRFDENYSAKNSDIAKVDIAAGWRPTPPGQARPALRDVILGLPKVRPHGQKFEYRSVETDVIAWVLERAAGQGLAALLSDRIWSRIGAERDAYFTVDHAGTALADGGFNATLRDYARFGAMMLNGGRVGDTQVVPSAWVDSLSHGEAAKFHEPYTWLSPKGAYRRQWWIHDLAVGDFMARGVFGQLIYVNRQSDFMAVKLSTWPDYLMPNYSADALRGLRAIREALGG
ncbi:MAG: serine hydrolase, partial [Rhodobacteraceae bacterium]|nr:serine hydrolase [Paracoccaceae bacterium]